MAIQISGTTVVDNSRNLTNIANASSSSVANTYVIVDANGFVCAENFVCTLGSFCEGGYLICKASSLNWIVAPKSSQVTGSWYCRNDAVTTAQSVSGCTGWFVPTISQLQNPGFTCKKYWDSYPTETYWSSTEFNVTHACSYCFFPCTTTKYAAIKPKNYVAYRVRAFRCVTY